MTDEKTEGKSGEHIRMLRVLEAELHRHRYGSQIKVQTLDFQSAKNLYHLIQSLSAEISSAKRRFPPFAR